MAWLVLLGSAVLEAVWATALSTSDGLTRPLQTTIFVLASVLSLFGLGRAMRTIPTGTAYAVWTGVGAALTAGWAMVTGAESAAPLKVVFLCGIVACVAGLKLIESDSAAEPRTVKP